MYRDVLNVFDHGWHIVLASSDQRWGLSQEQSWSESVQVWAVNKMHTTPKWLTDTGNPSGGTSFLSLLSYGERGGVPPHGSRPGDMYNDYESFH